MVVELRVDPEDDRPCSLEELREKYWAKFTRDEIEEYWAEDCSRVPLDLYPPQYGAEVERENEAIDQELAVPLARGGYAKPDPSETRVDPKDGIPYRFRDLWRCRRGSCDIRQVLACWFDAMAVDLPAEARVFVGGLSPSASPAAVREGLSERGDVTSCEVFRRQAAGEGFAVAQYTTVDAALRAQAEGIQAQGARLAPQVLSTGPAVLFVGALPRGGGLRAEELEDSFAPCGPVLACSLDAAKGQARVDFVFAHSVRRAVDTHHLRPLLGSRRAVVQPWREDDFGERAWGPSVLLAGLAPEADEAAIQCFFEEAGVAVVDVYLGDSRQLRVSRGAARVECCDEQAAAAAACELDGAKLDGASVVVRNLAVVPQEAPCNCTIFVSSLAPDIGEERLRAFFAAAGRVHGVHLPVHPETGELRGFATVRFKSEEAFRRALAFDGAEFCGRGLSVRPYETQSAQATPSASSRGRHRPPREAAPAAEACPAGHLLRREVAAHAGGSCDECAEDIAVGAEFRCCRACGWCRCAECHRRALNAY